MITYNTDGRYPHPHIFLFDYLLEYAMKAATSSGNTAVAVRGAKSAAFITQKKVPVSLLQ